MEVAVPIVEFQRLLRSRPARWWNLLSKSLVRQSDGIIVFDADSAAYVEAEQKYGSMTGDPVATVNPLSLLWKELHSRPLKSPDLSKESAWLNHFIARVPCGSCRRGFREIIKRMPPDLSSRWGYAKSTVGWHDAVNQVVVGPSPMPRAGFPLEMAIEMYGWREIVR
jgi:hypothetical protein